MREGVALRRPVRTPQALPTAEAVLAVDMLGRDFGDDAAGDAAHPLAINAPIGGVINARALPRPRDRDIGEAALLLEALRATFVHRALRREDAILPSGKEDMVELKPFRGVDRHDRNGFGGVVVVAVHDEADMFEERLERFIFLHRADEFGEVLKPACGLDAAVGLEHRGVARFVEDQLGQLGMRQLVGLRLPAAHLGNEIRELAARLRRQLVGFGDARRGVKERRLLDTRKLMDAGERLVAEPALRRVDDPFERQIIGARLDEAEIGERIADFGALIETEPADDPVRHADCDKTILELARLELRAHEDRGAVERHAAALERLQLLADPSRLLGPVPHADDAQLVAGFEVGPQRLAEAARILRDQRRRGGKNLRRRTIILFEADHGRAGEILFEAQDVRNLGAAPRIDRLVVVADAANVLPLLRKQAEPEILAGVGVLIFVDEDIFEAVLILREYVAVGLQDYQHVEQKVAEIAGVERLQPRLIERVEMLALAVGVGFLVGGVEVGRNEPAVFPFVDEAGELARWPAFLVESLGLNQLFEDAQLVVGVEDREIALQADQLGVAAQHLGRDAVEGAEPGHAFDDVADHPPDAFAHFARRLVGEGHCEDFGRPRTARRHDVREARGQRGGLACSRARKHQHRTFGRQHCLALRAVEALQIGRVRRVGRGQVGQGGRGIVHARTIREQRAGCPVR